MPNAVNRNLDALQPAFLAKVRLWLNDVAAESKSPRGSLSGVELYVNETLRSYARSDELYAQGRDPKKPGPIVTNAKGGQSPHNFGLAVDVYPMRNGKAIFNFDQDPALMRAMERVAVLAKGRGIDWGGNFKSIKDLPHFQDADMPALVVCQQRWANGWIPGVSHA